jgi:hypothetical protein
MECKVSGPGAWGLSSVITQFTEPRHVACATPTRHNHGPCNSPPPRQSYEKAASALLHSLSPYSPDSTAIAHVANQGLPHNVLAHWQDRRGDRRFQRSRTPCYHWVGSPFCCRLRSPLTPSFAQTSTRRRFHADHHLTQSQRVRRSRGSAAEALPPR